MMQIKVLKLHTKAKIPCFMTSGAAGFDLYSVESKVLMPNCGATFEIGIAFELPIGWELQIRGRSGNWFNRDVSIGQDGTVDSDYRGRVKVKLWNHGSEPFFVAEGARIAQGVISRVERVEFLEVAELDATQRGTGGFGHTGVI